MRAVIYIRVSSEDQVRNLSLESQESACRSYCAQHGYEVAELFSERGESAKTADRTKFQEMLAYCQRTKGRIGVVVVYNLSRFARNVGDHQEVKAFLGKYNIVLRSVTEPIDDSASGRLLETMLSGVAQFENEVKRVTCTGGMKKALEKGRWVFKAPIGYLNSTDVNDDPILIHDPERAGLVQKAFELFSTGLYSQKQVREIVTDMGLQSHRNRKMLPQAGTLQDL